MRYLYKKYLMLIMGVATEHYYRGVWLKNVPNTTRTYIYTKMFDDMFSIC